MMPGVPWEDEEDEVVKRLYPDIKAIAKALPKRTIFAIKSRAARHGIRASHIWTGREIKIIKATFPLGLEAMCSALPHLSKEQIHARAKGLGLRRRDAMGSLGIPPLDAIRDRAKAQGIRLGELGRRLGAGTYFSGRLPYVRWQHIAAAAEILGGHIEIVWLEQ
jgi:hypothetical protein